MRRLHGAVYGVAADPGDSDHGPGHDRLCGSGAVWTGRFAGLGIFSGPLGAAGGTGALRGLYAADPIFLSGTGRYGVRRILRAERHALVPVDLSVLQPSKERPSPVAVLEMGAAGGDGADHPDHHRLADRGNAPGRQDLRLFPFAGLCGAGAGSLFEGIDAAQYRRL